MNFLRPSSQWRKEDPNDGPFADDGTWDSTGRIVGFGVMVPLLLLAWIAFDLYRGYTVLASRRSVIELSFERDPVAALGISLVKFGCAAWLVARFVIANHPKWGWYSENLRLILLVCIVLAVLMSLVGLLMHMG